MRRGMGQMTLKQQPGSGVMIAGGVRFVSIDVAERELPAAMEHRGGRDDRPASAVGPSADRPSAARPSAAAARVELEAHTLLDWRGVAELIYGPRDGGVKTWDAIAHLWNRGVSDRCGGVVKLAFVETPSGRRSSVEACRRFMREVDERRKAARERRHAGQVQGRTPARGQTDAGLGPAPEH